MRRFRDWLSRFLSWALAFGVVTMLLQTPFYGVVAVWLLLAVNSIVWILRAKEPVWVALPLNQGWYAVRDQERYRLEYVSAERADTYKLQKGVWFCALPKFDGSDDVGRDTDFELWMKSAKQGEFYSYWNERN